MKFPTIKEMAEEVADKAIDEVEYNGKTLREWMEIIETASEDTISRRAAINVIPKKQNGTGGESWMKTYRRSGHNDCVDACVTALQGLPPVTYTKINPPSDYARQFGLIPKEDATDINVATKDSTNLASLGTDCISRQQAIEALRKMQTYKMFSGDDMLLIDQAGAQTELMLLPPAEPKKGKWIKTARWGRVYYCNQCRNYLDFDGVNAGRGSTNFCPNCGAEMEKEVTT